MLKSGLSASYRRLLISCSNFYWLIQLKHDTMHCTPEISNSNLKTDWKLQAKYCHLLLKYIFSSPHPNCHHLASVVVVRRKLFKKYSPLNVRDQWKPNLVWIITRVSSVKIVPGDAVHQPTWPLLLKIEHMVKLQVLGNNSKTVNNIKKPTLQFWSKSDYPSWSCCPF